MSNHFPIFNITDKIGQFYKHNMISTNIRMILRCSNIMHIHILLFDKTRSTLFTIKNVNLVYIH